MKGIALNQLNHAGMRRLAEQLDNKAGVGDANSTITTNEVDKAIAAAEADPARGPDLGELRSLRTFLQHFGSEGGSLRANVALSGGGYSPIGMRAGHMSGDATMAQEPIHLGEGSRIDGTARVFRHRANILERQSIVFPLDEGALHLVEVRYQDTRPLKDLEFNMRKKGEFGWTTFRGDQYFEMKRKEDAGEIEIKREPDHNGPWVNNPVRVKVEVLYPDGRIHDMGKKFIDFHVHDARSVNGSGTAETDNIYKRMPHGELPAGSMMRLTPYFENKKPWEKDRDVACDFHFVKPIIVPKHKEKVRVRSASRYETPPPGGFDVDPNRKIAAVMVNWHDNGGTSRGSVSIQTDRGTLRSQQYNVGSGETELIPIDGYAKDGKLKIHTHGHKSVDVRNLDVLYAE